MPKKKRSVRLSDEVLAALGREAKRLGLTISSVVEVTLRRALGVDQPSLTTSDRK